MDGRNPCRVSLVSRRDLLLGASATALGVVANGQAPAAIDAPARRALGKAVRDALGGMRGTVAVAAMAAATEGREALLFASEPTMFAGHLAKPGSTVKPFLLWHLLRSGAVNESTEHHCRGELRMAGRALDCSHAPQPSALRPEEALALSCNQFFLHAAERLQPGELAGTLRRFGMDTRRAFGMDGAAATVGTPARRIETVLQAIGESQVLVTPLSLLHAYRRLLLETMRAPLSPESRLLRRGMERCVREGTGADSAVPGLSAAGKTGTATSPERQRLDGWFLSYAPAEKPRFVMAVFVENGRGGVEAAPVAGAAWKTLINVGAFR